VQCLKADLMDPPFEDGKFDYITCLSVIEHEVDFNKLSVQCSRLLKSGGFGSSFVRRMGLYTQHARLRSLALSYHYDMMN
jgi:2-polyprenyl-3-methyl-5-hydroxy-6-metoxy-1,4-benzoquinol methylase